MGRRKYDPLRRFESEEWSRKRNGKIQDVENEKTGNSEEVETAVGRKLEFGKSLSKLSIRRRRHLLPSKTNPTFYFLVGCILVFLLLRTKQMLTLSQSLSYEYDMEEQMKHLMSMSSDEASGTKGLHDMVSYSRPSVQVNGSGPAASSLGNGWKTSVERLSFNGSQICRISNACLSSDFDSLIVPKTCSASVETSILDCGHSAIEKADITASGAALQFFDKDLLLVQGRVDGSPTEEELQRAWSTMVRAVVNWETGNRTIPGKSTEAHLKRPTISSLGVTADNFRDLSWWKSILKRFPDGTIIDRSSLIGSITCFSSVMTVLPDAGLDMLDTSSDQNDAPESPQTEDLGKSGEQMLEVFHLDKYPDKPICRIHHAGRTSRNTLRLKPWLKAHDFLLKEKCGFSELEYNMSDDELRSSDFIPAELFGPISPRDHNVTFALDISVGIYIQHALIGRGSRHVNRQCYTHTGEVSCDSSVNINKFALMVPESQQNLEHDYPWISTFAALFEDKSHSVVHLQPSSLSDGLKIFRGVIGARRISHPSALMGSDNAFFQRAGTSRKSTFQGHKGPAECRPRVLILDDGKTAPGHMEAIRTSIARELNVVGAEVGETVKLHLLEPLAQFRLVNSADVLIAPSSQYLGNLLFLRPKAVFVEIQPFGYYVQTHAVLAKLVSASFHSYSALPDSVGFKKCIERQNNKEAEAVLQMWHKAVQVMPEAGQPSSLRLDQPSIEKHTVTSDDRFCARSQRLSVNPEHFSRFVAKLMKSECQ